MSKNSLFMPAIILCVICLITVGLVALTFGATLDARQRQAEITANANKRELFPDAAQFAPIENIDSSQYPGLSEAFIAQDAGGAVLGYLIEAEYRGYGGNVPVLLAFGPDVKILRLKVLTNDETPGLGKKVESKAFLEQYVGLGTDKDLSVNPKATDKYIIDAVSGATISSRAVTEAVNVAIRLIRQISLEVK
jgi:Na+-translocating ferredoxin:NAD+ oxidoreductase subunit G